MLQDAAPGPAVMSLSAIATAPATRLLCVLLSVSAALQHSDVRLILVAHGSFLDFSCSQEPQPCSWSALEESRCKEVQLSPLHRPQSPRCPPPPPPPAPPPLQAKRLTVWFSSPTQAAHLLNNSEVRNLTLVHCGPGEAKARPPSPPPPNSHFTVQHLDKVTVVSLQQRPAVPPLDGNSARSSDTFLGGDAAPLHPGTARFSRAKSTIRDLFPGTRKDFRVQEVLLGWEQGAAFYEQARLAVIHSSVLEPGAVVKAYTVLTHIDTHGMLPFPELQLPKLPETSVIYVSFVY